jgi:cytosine/creatinine deaminase
VSFLGEGPRSPAEKRMFIISPIPFLDMSELSKKESMDQYMQAAYEEALAGRSEGGIPIGAVIVRNGEIVARGHNQRIQKGDPILHGEMDALTNAGRRSASFYRECTLYTTLSPCIMCSGAIVLYGIPEVVVGEDVNYPGEVDFLRSRGVKVTILNDPELIGMMKEYIDENPAVWNEDISVEL